MSRIDELIAELCPDGVEFKPLGEVGTIARGRRFVKTDMVQQGTPCIHYGELYTKYGVSADVAFSFLEPQLAARLRVAEPGDVIFVSTGETVEDIGKAVAWLGESDVVIHDALYSFRSPLDPKYVAYFAQTDQFHLQIRRSISSSKVSAISPQSLGRVVIPIPPVEVQQEIVRILDEFTRLEAELGLKLEAELEARRRQYRYYRDALLAFDERGSIMSGSLRWMTLGELAEIGTGSRNTNEAVLGGQYPFYVRSQEPLAIGDYEFDETAIITAGDGVGVGRVFHLTKGKYALHQRAYRIVCTSALLKPEFLFHFIRSDFARYLEPTSVHASVTSLRRPMFERYPIPVPSLAEQDRIVAILDRFDALVNDLSIGLPAELKARRAQYAHYRDRLLTFREAS